MGKLWVTVNYFHPALAKPSLDWNGALVSALPAIRSASTADAYAAAVASLLSVLPKEQHTVPQTTWVHTDLEHSAFLTRNVDVTPQPFDMGGGLTVRVQLSERAGSAAASAPLDQPPHDDASGPYPSTEQRILAAYKLWGAVHFFFAYRDLMDADWDDAFPRFLQQFINAKDAREYHLAVAQAVTTLDDSRSQANSAVLDDYFGTATLPLRLRLVDKKPLVSEVLDEAAAQAGIRVGDIVLRVDDEDMVKRIDREAAYLPASTHQALAEIVMQRILNGSAGSEAVLTLRHRDGAENEVRLKRIATVPEKHDALVKQLSAKAAYLDATQLTPENLEASFQAVAGKDELLLDARGALRMDARPIAAKFNSKPEVAGLILTGPLLIQPDLPKENTLSDSASFFSVENVPVSTNIYKGNVVMLIDGRTIAEAEHLGALLKAALRIAFIGTDSAGACGAVRHFALPGGIRVSLSAVDVRLGDTGKLQRLGLTPAVVAAPDLNDVRSGRDPVLEKALEFLSSQQDPADKPVAQASLARRRELAR